MKTVGMYRKTFPLVSETFISEQASGLTRYNPFFIVGKLIKEIPFPHVALNQQEQGGLKQSIHYLTRSPDVFKPTSTLKHLNLIHAHFGPDGVYAMALAERLNIPFLVSIYGYDATISAKTLLRAPLAYQFLLHERELQQKASVILANSKFLCQTLLKRGYPPEKVVLQYLGVDVDKFTPERTNSEERYILCVARHTEKKGIDTLLRAFARIANKHPDVTLIQVGSGSLSQELHTLTDELGMKQRVRFLGSQPYDVVQKLTHRAELYALPSQTARDGDCEGLPCVLLEASACGIPIVSTWHSGIPEAVMDGETGFLVNEKDDVTLAEKMDILLSDRALGQQMGQRGREFVCDCFAAQKCIAKLEQIYDSVVV